MNFDEMNMIVENCDVNGAYFYMNISPGSVINSRDFFVEKEKR